MSVTNRCLKICAGATAVLLLVALCFSWIVGNAWTEQKMDIRNAMIPKYDAGNLLEDGMVITQTINTGCTEMQSFSFWTRKVGEPEGELLIEFLQKEEVLSNRSISFLEISEYAEYSLQNLELKLDRNAPLSIRFSALQSKGEGYVSVYYGDSVTVAGRYEAELGDASGLMSAGIPIHGQLAISYCGTVENPQTLRICWFVMILLIILADLMIVWFFWCKKTGRHSKILNILDEFRQYSFLMSQLVSRNFNTKYRQSVLGVFWSILNPLLTTAVLYFVFSTIFRQETENYIVYLLSGIIVWNAFVEAVNLGMESITGSASIINKVYVPRYIYPISNVISALINLLISLIPMVLICLITGLRITKAYLLLPIAIALLFVFAAGMSLILATSNVFFRDTRFLWGVVTMMWTYLTPIFYTETIIPEAFRTLYHANPMYQFLFFFRSILIQGVTPQPAIYLYSLVGAVVPLMVGIWLFARNQNKFVLYL